ncbi:MAG: M61 family metallopeptidase [Oscillatoriales cyanobacterium SM2_2_1]|nr:M61 family metallopeptidase [Oscillatoriales cyanobacterium SM2_2_1]
MSLSPFGAFTVAMPQPNRHRLEISFTIPHWTAPVLEVRLPVWSPGSYLVREYARLVQEFTAVDGAEQPRSWQKVAKNCWRIAGTGTITIRYVLFANELTVRTNHGDGSHGSFLGSATFIYVPEYTHLPLTVQVLLPDPLWRVATPLPCGDEASQTYIAPDYDTLADAPFEVGLHQRHDFEVLGKQHSWVIWGQGESNLPGDRLIGDTVAIIEAEAQLFGALPYDHYWFLLLLSGDGYGGLEHRNCCSLIYPRLGFRAGDSYYKFLNLVAHEFFHTWNVKRLRPLALQQYDYDRETYTHSLWFAEGVTSYYDLVIPLRAKIYDGRYFLQRLSESITRLQTTPGRRVQSLYESSFDTWIKLYRPDANTVNSQVSYYLKGELVALLLDLWIREQTTRSPDAVGQSLDDVLRLLWQQFGVAEVGYTEADVQAAVVQVTGCDPSFFWQMYLMGTAELDYNAYLEPFGLQVQMATMAGAAPDLGIRFQTGTVVKSVLADSPAEWAGIAPGHEVLAINGLRVTAADWRDRLSDFAVGDRVEVTFFADQHLRSVPVALAAPQCDRYVIGLLPQMTPMQKQRQLEWLGEILC